MNTLEKIKKDLNIQQEILDILAAEEAAPDTGEYFALLENDGNGYQFWVKIKEKYKTLQAAKYAKTLYPKGSGFDIFAIVKIYE